MSCDVPVRSSDYCRCGNNKDAGLTCDDGVWYTPTRDFHTVPGGIFNIALWRQRGGSIKWRMASHGGITYLVPTPAALIPGQKTCRNG